jgi:hypothetical protein
MDRLDKSLDELIASKPKGGKFKNKGAPGKSNYSCIIYFYNFP